MQVDKNKEKGASSEGSPQGNEPSEAQSPLFSQVSREAESPQSTAPTIRRTGASRGPAVLPTPPTTQATLEPQATMAPITRTPPTVIEEDDDEEEEEEEEETENSALREFGIDDGQEFEDDDVGFDEDYGDGYE